MNANAFITRFEIFLYSTLTYAMSGMNHIRAKLHEVTTMQAQPSAKTDFGEILLDDQQNKGPLAPSWETIKVILPPLFLWIVLGFAAGFLIGMLKPR
jgi:hypothetical protein